MKPTLAMAMLFSMAFFMSAQGQDESEPCGTEFIMQQQLQNPAYRARHDSFELQLYQQLNGRPLNAGGMRQIYTIPVVVHVIHNGGSENIPDAQVHNAIQNLNDGFRNRGAYDPSNGVDVEVEFCLATQSPTGTTTTGINRIQSPLTNTTQSQDVALKNLSRWAPTQYLNIWVVKSIGGSIAGYATLPSSHGSNRDGIVCRVSSFGVNLSKTLIHEAGHYLGLYHSFQGGCANNNCLTQGDRVCDTPPDNSTMNPCNTNVNSCTTDDDDLSTNNPFRPVSLGGLGDRPDDRLNYMDYSNHACRLAFTQGQKNRVVAAITGIRSSLLQSNGCQSSPCAGIAASFTASSTAVTAGTTVTFTNTSTGATSYNWQINGTTFATSTNASYTFNTDGFFTITLTASNGTCTAVSSTGVQVGVGCTTYSVEWQNSIGGSGSDMLYSAVPTTDGGYILGGHSISPLSGDKSEDTIGSSDYWVVKLNSAGNIQWQNTLGGTKEEKLWKVRQTSDGGYICGGYSSSGISGDKTEINIGNPIQGNHDFWIVKLNSAGNIQWQNTIGANLIEAVRDIQQTTDGGYIVAGQSASNISGDKTENNQAYPSVTTDYWVVKLSSTGNIQWQNTLGGNNSDYVEAICQAPDGGYLVGGWAFSNISGKKTENSRGGFDMWIVKLSSSGTIQWQKTIGGSGTDRCYTLIPTADGGYLLGGRSASDISGEKTQNSKGLFDYWVVKINSTGTIQWQKTIGGSADDYLYSMVQTADGGYMLVGDSKSGISGDKTEANFGSTDYWMIKLDPQGNIVWQKTLGGSGYDSGLSIGKTTDGGFILGGFSSSPVSGNKTEGTNGGYDYWVVKVASCSSAPLTPDAFLGNDTSICSGNYVVLDAGSGFTSYEWQDGSNGQTFNATNPGTYWVEVTMQNGSTVVDSIEVYDVLSSPPVIDAGGVSSLCLGNTATLEVSDGYYSYEWQDGWNEPDYTAYLPGTYIVRVSDPCGNSASDTVVLAENVAVSFSLGEDVVFCDIDSVTLSAPTGYTNYEWQDGSAGERYVAKTPGDYWVEVIDQNGCFGADSLKIDYCTGIEGGISQEDLLVFPNPASERITIVLNRPTQSVSATVELFNSVGQKILSGSLAGSNEIDVSALSTGLYFLQVRADGLDVKRKVVVE